MLLVPSRKTLTISSLSMELRNSWMQHSATSRPFLRSLVTPRMCSYQHCHLCLLSCPPPLLSLPLPLSLPPLPERSWRSCAGSIPCPSVGPLLNWTWTATVTAVSNGSSISIPRCGRSVRVPSPSCVTACAAGDGISTTTSLTTTNNSVFTSPRCTYPRLLNPQKAQESRTPLTAENERHPGALGANQLRTRRT